MSRELDLLIKKYKERGNELIVHEEINILLKYGIIHTYEEVINDLLKLKKRNSEK